MIARWLAGLRAARAERAALRQAARGLPPGLDWERLAAEMTANIKLGLAAGAVLDEREAPVPPVESFGWRAAVVVASFGLVLVSGWWLGRAPGQDTGLVLTTRSHGIAWQQRGARLEMLTPPEQRVTFSAQLDGGASASFVDAETGQVTITHVAAE